MRKYLQVFKISFQQEFAYRFNFVMWRVRNVMQIFLLFYLWTAVFSDQEKIIFGYDRAKILTYVFGIMVVKAIVLSARAVDVAGEISNGNLSNYLLKPVDYFKYWLTRDLSSKTLNLCFAILETIILFVILKPQIFIQTNFLTISGFLLFLVLALLLYFELLMITSSVPFWAPEMGWASQFLLIVIVTEFLSGAMFPLDILPSEIQKILYFTPFPYLIFFPIQVYLGKVVAGELFTGIIVALSWVVILWLTMKFIWRRGLLVYRAEGR